MTNNVIASGLNNSKYKQHTQELSESLVSAWYESLVQNCQSVEPIESKYQLIRDIGLGVIDMLCQEQRDSEGAFDIGRRVSQLNLLDPEKLAYSQDSFLSFIDKNLSKEELLTLYPRFLRIIVDIAAGYAASVRENTLIEQQQILSLIEKAKIAAEEAKSQIETRNNAIVETIPEILIIIDEDGNIKYHHAGLGIPRIISKNIEGINIKHVIPNDLYETFEETAKKAHSTGKMQVITTSYSIQNNSHYFEGRIVPYEEDKILAVVRDITDIVEFQNQIKINQSRLQEMTRQLISVQEYERHQIALDLHDDVLSQLGALLLFIDETELPQQFLDNYHKLIDQIRTTIYRLRPAMLNYGLYPALEDHFAYLRSFVSPQISLITDVTPSTVRFDPDVELHLFRIIQESISNAIKHSQADQIIISGNIGYNDVWFTIEDNGIGMPYGKDIDLTKVLANNHFGIAGMFERAILIGAKILFNSLTPQGTKVSITLNLMD